MVEQTIENLKYFFCIGLNYKKSSAYVRGRFSVGVEEKTQLLQKAKNDGVKGLLVISTCNRTELYGFVKNESHLIDLLCHFSDGTKKEFQECGYIYNGLDVVNYFYKVAAGLDSQILGDFEIISQIKNSAALSKENGMLDVFMERLLNSAIQTSKKIKNQTDLSTGAASVSFAAASYIMSTTKNIQNKNILLYGVGKIGRNTCENLVKHIKNKKINLINRTFEKAEILAYKYDLEVKSHENLQEEINNTDILIVATGAQAPTILKNHINTEKSLLVLDLSIPQNVSKEVQKMENVTYLNVDKLSYLVKETIEKRKTQIPKAEQIIKESKLKLHEWLGNRIFAPVIVALKEKLNSIQDAEINFQKKKNNDLNVEQAQMVTSRVMHKITSQVMNHFINNKKEASQSIKAIEQIFQL